MSLLFSVLVSKCVTFSTLTIVPPTFLCCLFALFLYSHLPAGANRKVLFHATETLHNHMSAGFVVFILSFSALGQLGLLGFDNSHHKTAFEKSWSPSGKAGICFLTIFL